MKFLLPLLLLPLLSLVVFTQVPVGISAHKGPIYTNAILGFVKINSFAINYSTCHDYPMGSSLQLNVVLQVNSTSGNYYFWLQNVASFPNTSTLLFADNIWNITAPNSNMSNVEGRGFIYDGIYVYDSYKISFLLPLSFYLLTNVSYNSTGVTITFGYIITKNGSVIPPTLTIYDKVYIQIYNVKSAEIVINNSIVDGLLDDAELVWGGYANGARVDFSNMSSYLAIYYNSSKGWIAFSHVYTYGSDTGETTNDLTVLPSSSGYAYVTVGNITKKEIFLHPPFPTLTFVNISGVTPFYVNGILTNSFVGYISNPITITYEGGSFTIIPSGINALGFLINGTHITRYYYISFTSPFPIQGYVNGKKEILHSGWFKEGTIIDLLNKTVYINSSVRYLLLSFNPGKTIVVNQSLNVYVYYVEQFLVNIQSSYPVYINGVRTNSMWVNYGKSIKITVSLPFYLSGFFEGTYNFPPGATIFVTQPLEEKLVTYLNVTFIANIILFSILGVASYQIVRGWRIKKRLQGLFSQPYLGIIRYGYAQIQIRAKEQATILYAEIQGLPSWYIFPKVLIPGDNIITIYQPFLQPIPGLTYFITLHVAVKGKIVKLRLRAISYM